jgi:hypothetical protein
MKPKRTLLCSQEPATSPYPTPKKRFLILFSYLQQDLLSTWFLTKLILTLFLYHRAFLNINNVLHQPNALIYLKNTKIFFKN